MRFKKESGFTLAEVLISALILSVTVLTALMFFTNTMRATIMARDMTEATSHAEFIMEEMYTKNSLSSISSTNWQLWAETEGLITLPNENISVGTTSVLPNLMEVDTTVAWERNGGTQQFDLKTRFNKSP